MNQEEFKAQYEDKILSNIDFVNSKGNYWLKLKYRVYDFLYNQYNTNITNITKIQMFKEYRINHREDDIGKGKFMNYLSEYFDIMEIDYKIIYKNWGRKYDCEQDKQNPYIYK